MFNAVILSNMTKKGIINGLLPIILCYAINVIIAPIMSAILLILVYFDWQNALYIIQGEMKIETALINNWKSMEIFESKLRDNLIKMLNKGEQSIKFKSNRDIEEWELRRINWYMKIFPTADITYKGRTITIKIH